MWNYSVSQLNWCIERVNATLDTAMGAARVPVMHLQPLRDRPGGDRCDAYQDPIHPGPKLALRWGMDALGRACQLHDPHVSSTSDRHR